MGRVIPFVVCLLGVPVGGTVLVPAEFREIVAGSDIIAHARVLDVRPEWVDGRRQINTVVTAEVLSSFKGAADRTITFKVPGGQIGRYRSVMVGAPVFRRGEEAVLFLESVEDDTRHIFGLNQGLFRVRYERRTGRRVVVSPILIASGEGPERVVRGSPARKALELDAFGAQVRAVLAAQAAPQGARR